MAKNAVFDLLEASDVKRYHIVSTHDMTLGGALKGRLVIAEIGDIDASEMMRLLSASLGTRPEPESQTCN